jgi:hypothetical protein
MSADINKLGSRVRGRWSRPPQPALSGPDRSFGGYYRTSDRKVSGKDFRGVPLQTAEDTAVAAVRMGYGIIDAQIERGLDMARRLRGAAARAGAKDANDVLDQAENLFSRGAALGLEWLESVANQPNSPLTRLLTAEYRMLGSLFGLATADKPAADPASQTPQATSTQGDVSEPSAPPPASRRRVRIKHVDNSTKRAVTIVTFDVSASPPPNTPPYELIFHLTSGTTEQFEATLKREADGTSALEIETTNQQPPGRWRAAICDSAGEQLGIVEIEL